MQRAVMLLLAFGAAACAPQIHSISGPVPQSAPDTFTCLMRELAGKGYRVQDSDRESGFIRAEKSRSSTGAQLLAGASYFTEVSATIIETGAGGQVHLQAMPVKEEDGRRSSTALTLPASEREEVSTIAAACGVAADIP